MTGYKIAEIENLQVYLFISTDYIQSSINLCFTLPNLCCQPGWNLPRRLDKTFLFYVW